MFFLEHSTGTCWTEASPLEAALVATEQTMDHYGRAPCCVPWHLPARPQLINVFTLFTASTCWINLMLWDIWWCLHAFSMVFLDSWNDMCWLWSTGFYATDSCQQKFQLLRLWCLWAAWLLWRLFAPPPVVRSIWDMFHHSRHLEALCWLYWPIQWTLLKHSGQCICSSPVGQQSPFAQCQQLKCAADASGIFLENGFIHRWFMMIQWVFYPFN